MLADNAKHENVPPTHDLSRICKSFLKRNNRKSKFLVK